MGEQNQRGYISVGEERYEVSSDGMTVWVDGPGGFVGRFGRQAIDIYNKLNLEESPGQSCLYFKKGTKDREDWETFLTKMKEFYGIEIPEKFTPMRFR